MHETALCLLRHPVFHQRRRDLILVAAQLTALQQCAAVYQAQSGGQPIGYAINVEASGSQGTISMMVGIDMDGAVTGVSIVTNSETSGIGSKVMGNEPLTNGTGVLDQFIGKSAADGVLSVGSNVDAITGATVSTKGVTTGVNAALAVAGVIG